MTITKRQVLRSLLLSLFMSCGNMAWSVDLDHDASPVNATGIEQATSTKKSTSEAHGILRVGFKSLGQGSGSCDTSCDTSCGTGSTICCTPWWAHRTGGWGEVLYLRPGSSDIVYTIEQNDVVPNAFPTGPVGDTQIQAEMGFRVGFAIAHDCESSYIASYSRWDGNDQDQIQRTGANVLNSEILHPSTLTTGAASLNSLANHDINFSTADFGYRSLWIGTDDFAINSFGGLRYGNMEQQFHHEQVTSVAVGLNTVDTDIDFDGFGLMFGADGAFYRCKSGLLCYSRGMVSFLAGEWNANYRQVRQFQGGVVANQFEDFRITPQTELELGFGWQNKTGNIRLSCGYLTSAWFDALSTRTYIEAVKAGNYVDVGETVTFSGMVTRAEVRF